jgi:hypothetical protein
VPDSGRTAELDGIWRVERRGGLLPPLIGVTKCIQGERGETRVAGVAVPFRVERRALRYRPPLQGFVDLLEPDAEGFSGSARFRGREFGRFVMRRAPAERRC